MSTTIAGIDPGLVHTGVVVLTLDPVNRLWYRDPHVISGLDVDKIVAAVQPYVRDATFIEAYRPRSHFANDARMTDAIQQLKRRLPGAVALDNTGVKQVVKPHLMKLLDVWNFGITTHHQDLRSAARIALYGALKDPALNELLTQFVIDHIDGNGWTKS